MTPTKPVYRAAWITGASTGIGRALALELAERGTNVAISARHADQLDAVTAEAQGKPGRIIALPLDVTDQAAVQLAAGATEQAIGPLDLVVANAGISVPMAGTLVDAKKFRTLFNVNVMGVVHVLEAVVPSFVQRRAGHLAVVSSVAGYRGLPTAAPYCASKAALIALCESLKVELDAAGVKIQVVNPGFVRTPLTEKNAFRMPFLLEPDDAARRLYAGLVSDRFEVTFPKRFTRLVKLMSLLPYPVYFALMRRLVAKRTPVRAEER